MSALDGADMPRESLGSRQWENKFRMNFMFHFRGAKSGIRQIATRAHAGSLFLSLPLLPSHLNGLLLLLHVSPSFFCPLFFVQRSCVLSSRHSPNARYPSLYKFRSLDGRI